MLKTNIYRTIYKDFYSIGVKYDYKELDIGIYASELPNTNSRNLQQLTNGFFNFIKGQWNLFIDKGRFNYCYHLSMIDTGKNSKDPKEITTFMLQGIWQDNNPVKYLLDTSIKNGNNISRDYESIKLMESAFGNYIGSSSTISDLSYKPYVDNKEIPKTEEELFDKLMYQYTSVYWYYDTDGSKKSIELLPIPIYSDLDDTNENLIDIEWLKQLDYNYGITILPRTGNGVQLLDFKPEEVVVRPIKLKSTGKVGFYYVTLGNRVTKEFTYRGKKVYAHPFVDFMVGNNFSFDMFKDLDIDNWVTYRDLWAFRSTTNLSAYHDANREQDFKNNFIPAIELRPNSKGYIIGYVNHNTSEDNPSNTLPKDLQINKLAYFSNFDNEDIKNYLEHNSKPKRVRNDLLLNSRYEDTLPPLMTRRQTTSIVINDEYYSKEEKKRIKEIKDTAKKNNRELNDGELKELTQIDKNASIRNKRRNYINDSTLTLYCEKYGSLSSLAKRSLTHFKSTSSSLYDILDLETRIVDSSDIDCYVESSLGFEIPLFTDNTIGKIYIYEFFKHLYNTKTSKGVRNIQYMFNTGSHGYSMNFHNIRKGILKQDFSKLLNRRGELKRGDVIIVRVNRYEDKEFTLFKKRYASEHLYKQQHQTHIYQEDWFNSSNKYEVKNFASFTSYNDYLNFYANASVAIVKVMSDNNNECYVVDDLMYYYIASHDVGEKRIALQGITKSVVEVKYKLLATSVFNTKYGAYYYNNFLSDNEDQALMRHRDFGLSNFEIYKKKKFYHNSTILYSKSYSYDKGRKSLVVSCDDFCFVPLVPYIYNKIKLFQRLNQRMPYCNIKRLNYQFVDNFSAVIGNVLDLVGIIFSAFGGIGSITRYITAKLVTDYFKNNVEANLEHMLVDFKVPTKVRKGILVAANAAMVALSNGDSLKDTFSFTKLTSSLEKALYLFNLAIWYINERLTEDARYGTQLHQQRLSQIKQLQDTIKMYQDRLESLKAANLKLLSSTLHTVTNYSTNTSSSNYKIEYNQLTFENLVLSYTDRKLYL